MLTTNLHLEPRFRISGAVTSSPYRSYFVDWNKFNFYCKRPAVVNIGQFASECLCCSSSIYVCPHSYYDLWLSVIVMACYLLILNYATPFCVHLLSILCLLLSPFSSPEFLKPFLVWRQLPMLFLFSHFFVLHISSRSVHFDYLVGNSSHGLQRFLYPIVSLSIFISVHLASKGHFFSFHIFSHFRFPVLDKRKIQDFCLTCKEFLVVRCLFWAGYYVDF